MLECPENWCRVQEAARLIMSALQQLWREEETAHFIRANPISTEVLDTVDLNALMHTENRASRGRRLRTRSTVRAEERLSFDVRAVQVAQEEEILRVADMMERTGAVPPPIPRRNRGIPPSPETLRMRYERRLFMQRLWRQRARLEEDTRRPLPPGRQRRSRAPPTEAELVRRRQRTRERQRFRRHAVREANRSLGEGAVLTPAEEAALTEEATSGRNNRCWKEWKVLKVVEKDKYQVGPIWPTGRVRKILLRWLNPAGDTSVDGVWKEICNKCSF